MRIVIIGDGKVGHTLTQLLSQEGHDIVIIDSSSKVVDNAVTAYDVMGISGNGASYEVQMEAGVNKADLLIAATSSDELNIMSCMVGKKIGARHTIARVRDPEYSKQLLFLKEELGLSMVVNPEMEAANEISRILRFPSALKIDSFARGRVDLVEIKILPGSPLAGKAVHTIHGTYNVRVLICVVQRGDDVFIPNGDFVLHEGDKITLTGAPVEITRFFKSLGILKGKAKSALIIGGGRIGYYLAKQLGEMGMMHIKIIEQDEKRCNFLCDALPHATIIHGDGSDQDILEEEGLDTYDACVALTGIDEENIIISMYADSKGIGKVITKINRMSLVRMLGSVGLASVISPKYITANRIVRYVRAMKGSAGSSVETLYKIVDQQVEAVEFHVGEGQELTGIPLKKLPLRKNLLLACIVRGGRLIIPGGDDEILPGDNVIIITNHQILRNLGDMIEPIVEA